MQNNDAHKKSGVVAITGPPNAGKSTLMNTFLGHKLAIVTPKPQTTRNSISGILSLDQAQIVFLDTPGLHQSSHTMNRYLVLSAWQALAAADLLLLVLDAARYTRNKGKMHTDLQHLQNSQKLNEKNLVIALNKVDQVRDKQMLLPVMDTLASSWPQGTIFPVSALQNQGTAHILDYILSNLSAGPALYPEDQLSTLPLKFLGAECIREKLFLYLGQELPYSLAVEIEDWQEDVARGQVWVHALIYVSRDAHKPIVVGHKGQMLKKVGQAARKEIEAMLEQKVHLELWVKVKHKWEKKWHTLQELIPQTLR